MPATTVREPGFYEAAEILRLNKSFIQSEITAWIAVNYPALVGVYDVTISERDLGYVIDAMRYDLTYEGNSQTVNAAKSFLNGEVLVGTLEECLASYVYLETIIGRIVKNQTIVKSTGNTATQNTSSSVGSPLDPNGPADQTIALVNIISDVLDHGVGYVPEVVSKPNYSYANDPTLVSERAAILNSIPDIQEATILYLNSTYGGSIVVTLFPPVQNVEAGTEAQFHNVSTVSTASTAMEYVGAGVTYNALPFFGGEPIPANERVEINSGKTFTVTSDQIGNYRIGEFFTVNALTGEVTIDAENINLQGLAAIGPFKRNGIPVGVQLREVSNNSNLVASTGLADINTVPTQPAVQVYVENRYLNKVTTNAESVASSVVTYAGDLGINGGDVFSTATTFNLLNKDSTASITNDGPTTVNAFLNTTALQVGASTGTTTVNNNLEVKGSIVSTTQTSVNLLNTTATTVNAFGAATTMAFGDTTGTATIKNATITFPNATQFNINGASPTLASTSTGTLTLFDTLITTVNAFRSATAINIGESSGTLTIISASTVLNGDLQVKGGDITTNQTSFNVINDTATTVNAFGAATTLNFAAGSGTTTIRNNLQVNLNSTFGTDTSGTFTASGVFTFNLRDNTSTVFDIKEASNSYIKINSDNAVELTTFGSLPKVTFLNTTDATSTSLAATTFSGGLGIAKSVYVGQNLNVAGNTTLGDDRTADTHAISGVTTVNVPDDTAIAFQVKENTQTYITAVTTNTTESVTIEATPKLLVKNTTDNTLGTAASGAAQFTGGVGIAKNATVGVDLTVNRDIVATGDLAVNGGDFTTTATSFNILNGTATTINFGGAGTSIAIGAATGTTNIKHNLDVDGDVNIDGGDLTVSTSTFNLANATATTINFGGAGTAFNLGGSAGSLTTFTLGNAANTGNIFKVRSTAAGTVYYTTDVTSGSVEAWQTVSGTVKIGSSGTVQLGTSSLATTTALVGGAIDGNTLKIAGTAAGTTAAITTDVTSGTISIFTGVTGNVNIGGAASTINLGATTGNTILEVRGSSSSGTATIRTNTGVTTANVFNTVATTGNLFGAGTTVSIGAGTGTTTINNDATVTLDLAVNGGDITSTATTFNLLNSTVTNGNLFGAGTTISIGAATGTTTINNANTVVTGDLAVNGGDLTTTAATFNLVNGTATTVNFAGASTTTAIGSTASGTTTIGFDLSVNGDVQVKGGDITTNQTTFNLINTSATTVNFAGAGTTVSIASGSGTTTVNNNLTVANDLQVKGGDFTVDAASTTFNLINTNATTVNAFGAATTIAIGANTGTITISNPTLVGTQTTQAVYNTTATTVNAFGAATTLNLGASSGTATISNAIVTTPGQYITTKANNTATGSGQIYLNGATGNRIDFNTNGSSAPALTTRSVGTKITLNPTVSASGVDYGIGIETNAMWLSVFDSSASFKFYAGTTAVVTIDGSGNVTYTGDLAVNGGDITTTATTATVFNTNAATVSAFGAGTTISIGAATGTTTINNATTTITGNANVNGGTLATTATTFNLINASATTVNFAGAGTTIGIGASTGTLTIGNPTITGTNAIAFNMNGANPSIATTNTGTASVFNTFATTGNLFGVATAANIATSAAALSTLTFGPAITGNIFKIGSTTGGTINLTTDVTSGIVNEWQSVTGTINVGSSGNINLGTSTSATTTVKVGGAFTGNTLKVAGTTVGTINLTTDVTSGTVNEWQSVTGTINIGSSGTVQVGTSATATTTLQVGGAFTGNTFKIAGTAAGAINLTTDVTTGTVNAYTGITTGTVNLATGGASTTNIGGAAGVVNIGTTGGDSILEIRANATAGTATLRTSAGGLTANVFNTVSTTGNAFGVATAINLGTSAAALSTLTFGPAITGNIFKIASTAGGTINLTTDVTSGTVNEWQSVTGTIKIGSSGTVQLGTSTSAVTTAQVGGAITGNTLKIAGTAGGTSTLSSDVTTGQIDAFTGITTGTLNLATGGASTTNIGGTANTVNIGTTAGNSILEVRGNATTGTATIRTNAGVTTANVFNTVATTGNAFGAATAINLGTGAAAASTLTFGPAITANTFKIGSTASGTINLTTDVTTGVVNAWTSLTTGTLNLATGGASTTNIGGAAAVLNIGTTAGDSIIELRGNATTGTATIRTTAGVTTANVFNTVATTGNLFGVATTANIATSASAASTLTFGPAITANTFKIGSTSGGTVNLTSDVTTGVINAYTGVTTGTVNLATGGASTTNIGGAAGVVNIGTTAGDSILEIRGNATTGTATVRTTAGVTTGNLFNTQVTTGNVFGAATAVNVGTSASALSTLTFGPAITGNIFKVSSTTGGTINLTTDVTSGTVNEWQSVTGTINVGSSGNINLGTSTSATTTVKVGGAFTGNTLKVAGTAAGTINLTTDVTTGIVNEWTSITTGTVNIATGGASTTNIGGAAAVLNLGTTAGDSIIEIRGNATTGTATLRTNSGVTTGNLFNTQVTTGNAFGVATAINLGTSAAAASTMTFGPAITANTFKIGSVAAGTVNLTSDVTTGVVNAYTGITTGTVNLATGGASTTNIGGAAGVVNIGTTGGDSVLEIRGNATTGTATIRTSAGGLTANVFNTVSTTGNVFGVATAVNVGTSAAALSTLTFGPAITGNIFKIAGTTTGTINLTTDVTSGTVNAWQSVTGTINIGASGTINLGTSTSATTTTVVGGAFTGNVLKIAGTTAGTVNLSSDVTTGIVNAFTGVTTGTVNIGTGGASTINIGGTSSTTNIKQLTLTTNLAVQYGGTGLNTITTNGVVYGNGTSAAGVTAASNPGSNATTSYGILTTNVSNVPVWTDTIDGGSY